MLKKAEQSESVKEKLVQQEKRLKVTLHSNSKGNFNNIRLARSEIDPLETLFWDVNLGLQLRLAK